MLIDWFRFDFSCLLYAAFAAPPVRTADPRHSVFIVEDHAGMRRVLRRLVGRAPGLRVVGEAASAEEALERFANELPELVIVDINLPGMNGIELIAALTRRYPRVRCVVVSAYAEPERRRAAQDAGARGFVSKDEPAEIVATLARVAEDGDSD